MAVVAGKICRECGADVSGRPRSKNRRGEYFCEACAARLRAAEARDQAPQRTAASGRPSPAPPQTKRQPQVALPPPPGASRDVGAVRRLLRRPQALVAAASALLALCVALGVAIGSGLRAGYSEPPPAGAAEGAAARAPSAEGGGFAAAAAQADRRRTPTVCLPRACAATGNR